jgi:hypothetical protein
MTSPTDAQWSAMSKCVQSFIQRADAGMLLTYLLANWNHFEIYYFILSLAFIYLFLLLLFFSRTFPGTGRMESTRYVLLLFRLWTA